MTGLADGDYRISVRPAGTSSDTWYGGTNSLNATVVTLDAADNDVDGIEIGLPSGRISGQITGGTLGFGWQAFLVGGTALQSISATVAPDGRFQFDYVPDGTYRVGFRNNLNLQGYAPGVERLDDARVVQISAATPSVDDVVITLPQGRISGDVTIGGQPLTAGTSAFVSVERVVAAGTPIPNPATSIAANVDGSYSVGNLFPGRYIVRASGSNTQFPGLPSTGTAFSAFHPNVATRIDATIIEITPTALTAENVDVDAQTRSISGVVQEGGTAVNGTGRNIEVRLSDLTNDTNRTVRVGSQGTFAFDNLGDGDYYISYNDFETRASGTYPTGDPDLRFASPITVDGATPTVDSIVIDLPDRGSIEGTITNAPPNAIVSLSTATAGQFVNQPVATATPVGGTFRFDGIAEGEYRVTTTVLDDPGYGAITIYAPGTLLFTDEQTVTVTAGSTATTTLDVPEPVTVSGRVTDPGGAGVEGVEVYRFDTEGFYTPTRRLIATTDDTGNYTSIGFLPKPTVIEFDPPEASGYASAFHGGSPLADGAEQLVLASGEQRTGIDGVLGLRGSISGTITGPDGQPAAALVQARAAGALRSFSLGVEQFQTEAVDGAYTLEGLPPGEWILDVLSLGPNGQASDSPYARTFSGNTMDRASAASFVLPSAGAVTQNVQLQAGQTIRGQVTRPDGRPLAGAQASIQPVDPTSVDWFVSKFGVSDADGRYEVRGITPGEIGLGHNASGLYPEFAPVYHPGVTNPNDSTPFIVPATGTIPDVDVQLGATVSGTATIVDSNGDPVDGALLNWFNAHVCPAPSVPYSSYGCSDNTFSGFRGRLADGTLSFVGLPPGEYNVGAVGLSIPSPATTTITVAAGETFHCTLPMRSGGAGASCTVSPAPPTGSISGTVLGPDGQPLAGAQVTAHVDPSIAVAGSTTDAAGAYQLDVPAGVYRIQATGPNASPGGQVSLPEWYDGSGVLYTVGPPPNYQVGYESATTIDVEVGIDLDGFDFALERYVTATATVIGGPPAGDNDSVVLCPAPTTPAATASVGPCVDPTNGSSFVYPNAMIRNGDEYRNDFIAPATYNVALIQYSPSSGVAVLSDTVQVTVAGSERFDCELALIGSGQTSTCTVSPQFTADDTDDDGVPAAEEAGAPNAGDGDNDGTPDSEQANVASLIEPSVVDPVTGQPPVDGSNYITLASKTNVPSTGAPAPLTSVKLAPAPPAPPTEGAAVQTGLISFAANFRDPVTDAPPATPVTASFEVFLPAQATQYWKYDEASTSWTDASSLASFDPSPTIIGGVERWRVVLTITDGGFGDADGLVNGIIDDPGVFTASLYRARQVGDRVHIERNVVRAAIELGVTDVDSDGDGWATVGRTNGASDNGPLANFRIDANGTPYAYVRHHQKACLELTPRSLDPVRNGQVRLMDQTADTSGCRAAPASVDTDGDGIADDEQPLYRIESDGRRIYVYRSVAAAEAQLGVSDWNSDGGTEVLYARTNGSGEFGVNEYLTVEDRDGDGIAEYPVLWAEHGRKGCQQLEPNRTDPVGDGQTRRMNVVDRPGGECPGPNVDAGG